MLIQDISDRQNIPLKYLQQILVSLKVAGFVSSRKGPGGGYLLAKDPSEITLGDVVRCVGGDLPIVGCMSNGTLDDCGCPNPDHCALRESFLAASAAVAAILDSTTFADLRDRQAVLSQSPVAFDFVI